MKKGKFIILISSIKKKLYKILNSKLKEYDLSIIEALYLLIVSEEDITFKELTKKADCDKAMTTKVLVKLKVKGLVKYDLKCISITELGKDVALNIEKIINEVKDNIIKQFGEEELKSIYFKLEEFNNILEGEIKC